MAHHHTTTTAEAAHTDRREFLRHLSLGTSVSACLIVAPEMCPAYEPPTNPAKAAEPEPPKDAKPVEPARPAPSELEAEIEARMGVVLARYGGKLDDAARQAVRREVAIIVGRGRALRQIALKNGDGPFPIFTPYRRPLP